MHFSQPDAALASNRVKEINPTILFKDGWIAKLVGRFVDRTTSGGFDWEARALPGPEWSHYLYGCRFVPVHPAARRIDGR